MKLSIIIAVLESYEIVKRQLLHFVNMNLPDDVEVIIVDDGSEPPIFKYLDCEMSKPDNLWIIETEDKRPWSQPCARNRGAKEAEGEYLLFTDIDHVLSKEGICDAYKGDYDKMVFPREWAVLDRDGVITQDKNTLYGYGLSELLYQERGVIAGMHPNTFAIRKNIFVDMLQGYDERYCGRYGGDDVDFGKRYGHLCRKLKKVAPHIIGHPIYVYPAPREDKKEVFHSIRRVIGRVEREDPICPECSKIYMQCLCYYPTIDGGKASEA